MKKINILILVFSLFMFLVSCNKKDKNNYSSEENALVVNSTEKKAETKNEQKIFSKDFYQFQVRKIPASIKLMENECDLYTVYFYESMTDTRHYVTTLLQEPTISDNGFNWYLPGGGFFYEVQIKENKLFLYSGETPEGKDAGLPWLNKDPELVFDFPETISPKEPVYLDVPNYSRVLKREDGKSNMFGADVFYVQEILMLLCESSVELDGKYTQFEPDGYFGICTEAAVRAVQKKIGFDETGIVDENFWNWLTAKENIKRF